MKFRKFRLEKITSNVIGSYAIKEENEIIGRSTGYTIKRRSILTSFYESKNNYHIIKRRKRFYLILLEDEIYAYLKIDLFYSKATVKSINDNLINFYSFDLGKSYKIKSKEFGNFGLAHSPNWLNQDIELATSESIEIELIICVLIAIGYNINTSPLRFLRS